MASGFSNFSNDSFERFRNGRLIESVSNLVYQAQRHGCAFASVKTLLSIHGERRASSLAEPLLDHAPSLEEVIAYAASLGLTLRAYEAISPYEILDNKETRLLLLLSEGEGLHMVCLSKVKRKHFVLLDPAQGERTVRKTDLVRTWTGAFLRDEGYEKRGEIAHRVIGPALPPLLWAFSLLPLCFLTLAVAASMFHVSPWLSLLGFLLSIASSLVSRMVTLGAMRRFDSRYMDGIDDEDPLRRREKLLRYHAYKRAAFITPQEVLGRLAIVAAVLGFSCLGDPYLASSLGVGVVASVLLTLLLRNKDKASRVDAYVAESVFLSDTARRGKRLEALRRSEAVSMAFARRRSTQEVFHLLLSTALAFLFTHFAGTLGEMATIVYFLATYFLIGEATRLAEMPTLLEEKKKEEPFFLLNIATKAK